METIKQTISDLSEIILEQERIGKEIVKDMKREIKKYKEQIKQIFPEDQDISTPSTYAIEKEYT